MLILQRNVQVELAKDLIILVNNFNLLYGYFEVLNCEFYKLNSD